jgi:hypothetical protein
VGDNQMSTRDISPIEDLQNYSVLQPQHTMRQMREFVLNESELHQISLMNSLASAFFSASSASFLFAVGLGTSALIQGSLTEKGIVLLWLGLPIGFLLSLGFALAGFWATKQRSSILDKIQKQSLDIQQIPIPQNFTNPIISDK